MTTRYAWLNYQGPRGPCNDKKDQVKRHVIFHIIT